MNGLINAELVRSAAAEVERNAQANGAGAGRARLARSAGSSRHRSTLRRLVRRFPK